MISDILELIQKKKAAEKNLYSATETLKSKVLELETVDIGAIHLLNYETAKMIHDEIYFFLDDGKGKELENVINQMKLSEYPELRKATYFPEINNLNISDEEKLRLDSAARANVRYYISKRNLRKLSVPLSEKDLDMLYELGIVTKIYNFTCPHCGETMLSISEDDFKKHQRFWIIQHTPASQLTDELDEEQENLYIEGYGYLYLNCMECGGYETEITTPEELDYFSDSLEIFYKFVKQPDLTYENI